MWGEIMKLLRFFYFYSFIAITGLIEVTRGEWAISEVTEGVVYAVVIPVIVVSIILVLSIGYETLKTGNTFSPERNHNSKSIIWLVGLLAIGIIFAYFPAMVGMLVKPVVGWFFLPPTLLGLHKLDKIVEGD